MNNTQHLILSHKHIFKIKRIFWYLQKCFRANSYLALFYVFMNRCNEDLILKGYFINDVTYSLTPSLRVRDVING